METGKLARNPIGCYVDPDDMAERYRNGEPASDILRDTYEGQPMIVREQLPARAGELSAGHHAAVACTPWATGSHPNRSSTMRYSTGT